MYRISASVRSTHSQDGATVLDVKRGQMFRLNFVGSRMLELFECGSDERDVVDAISREFEISREIAERDVRDFLQSLAQNGIVEELELAETNWSRS